MDNQNNTCNGQCARCSFQQRVYCAAYMSRNNYSVMEGILTRLEALQGEIAEMHNRINAIQSSEGELIKPFMEEDSAACAFEATDTTGQAV